MNVTWRTAWRSCGRGCRTIAAVLALAGPGATFAAPYHPASDGEVLEQVPARSALERLGPLRAAVAARPADLPAALALATGFIAIGRREGDPRFIAYAEATLQPWIAKPQAPEPALVLQAIALQYLHQFDGALDLLDRALAISSLDGQAWVTRAALLELKGQYAEARRSCARLARASDALVALTCLESVNSRTGGLAASYASLRASLPGGSPLPAELRSWALSVLEDMAERLGDDAAAESALRDALAESPDDPFLEAAYADLLLRHDRNQDVVALLRGREAHDALLLRLAIAGRRSGAADAQRWAATYEERLAAALRDHDATHERERAMFLLEVRGDADGALRAAAANWAVQREPADVRIYAAAAARSGSRADLGAIRDWVAATHYEDRALAAISPSDVRTRP